MDNCDRYNVACFIFTILINITSFIVLFLHQRRKYRNIKIIIFNLFLIHILFAVNQITPIFISTNKKTSNNTIIIAGSRDVAAFLLLVYSLNLDILALQCVVNATRTLKDALDDKKMQNLTIICVLACWFVPLIIALPLILLQVQNGGSSSNELETYLQIILLIALVNLNLVLVSDIYIAFRTWIKVDPNNIINFTVNRKNVVMTMVTTIIYTVSGLPYMAYHLGASLPASVVNITIWFDILGVPMLFLFIYCAKDFYYNLERIVRNMRQREIFRQMTSGDNNNNITVINSFTHVQPVVLAPDETDESRIDYANFSPERSIKLHPERTDRQPPPEYVLPTISRNCMELEETQSSLSTENHHNTVSFSPGHSRTFRPDETIESHLEYVLSTSSSKDRIYLEEAQTSYV